MILYNMMNRSFFLVFFLSLIYLAQRFWFVRAWRLSNSIKYHWCKILLRSVFFIAVLLLSATVLDLAFGHFIPRQGPGNWVFSASRLWLLTSFFGFLAVLSVEILGWLSRLGMYAMPSARRMRFDPA